MGRATLVPLVLMIFYATTWAQSQNRSGNQRSCPTFTVELISTKREYKVGEEWVGELKVTATAQADGPLTIRAWARFFAEYDVLPELHGPINQANLSDVLSTCGQVWRDGVPVVLWNSPVPDVFGKAAQTKVPAGSNVSVTFKHHFGSALKPGRFRKKLWFAIVVEPNPNHFMLLFAREPVDVAFVVQGDEITYDTYHEQSKGWFKANRGTFHDSQPIYSERKEAGK